MKKKTLLIVSMLVLVMFALTACGGKSPKNVVEDNLKQIKTEKTSSNVSKLFNDKTLEQNPIYVLLIRCGRYAHSAV